MSGTPLTNTKPFNRLLSPPSESWSSDRQRRRSSASNAQQLLSTDRSAFFDILDPEEELRRLNSAKYRRRNSSVPFAPLAERLKEEEERLEQKRRYARWIRAAKNFCSPSSPLSSLTFGSNDPLRSNRGRRRSSNFVTTELDNEGKNSHSSSSSDTAVNRINLLPPPDQLWTNSPVPVKYSSQGPRHRLSLDTADLASVGFTI